MVIGYLISGVGVGLLAALSSVVLGHSLSVAVLTYSLSGMMAMLTFAMIVASETSRD